MQLKCDLSERKSVMCDFTYSGIFKMSKNILFSKADINCFNEMAPGSLLNI